MCVTCKALIWCKNKGGQFFGFGHVVGPDFGIIIILVLHWLLVLRVSSVPPPAHPRPPSAPWLIEVPFLQQH
jgi:hypothetical protein